MPGAIIWTAFFKKAGVIFDVMKIIIVGATSGIGKEMALGYVQQGHAVAVTGRRETLLEELKKRSSPNFYCSF